MPLEGRVTEHFWWTELDVTEQRDLVAMNQTALARDLTAQANLLLVCAMLETVRSWWNKPISITSAYRTWELNARIGGSKTSDHPKGCAVDFRVMGVALPVVFERIVASDLRFGQAILEPIGPGARWIHLSLPAPWTHNTREVIR